VFSRYVLRTIAVDDARRFYADAVGLVLPEGADARTSLEAWPLHERARSAGAPPHWLGHLEVDDVERAVAAMAAVGAEPLGPTVRAPDGAAWATLRDPSGAVVALRARGEPPPDRPVAWHQLHARDLDRVWPIYAELAGWRDAGTIAAADPEGGHHLFSWSGGAVGSVASTARWQGVHPHWLFYFPVDDVAATAERVRSGGGTALVPGALADGRRIAVCEDPQGAAFGVIERP
jgi:predicted enzyme related to lactoylglutathione lyase